VLRFERRVEVEHDPVRPVRSGQREQLREQVLAQRAGQAPVLELQHRRLVERAAPQPAAQAARSDVAQVVVQHGDVRVDRADAGEHRFHAWRVHAGQHQQLGSGHGVLLCSIAFASLRRLASPSGATRGSGMRGGVPVLR
jgi:hypothetical protein